jgi:hypothetical protein
MDPYLESSAYWPGIHQRFITYLADDLADRLPPRYVAITGERVTVDEPDRDIYPDVSVLERKDLPPAGNGPAAKGLLVRDPPLLVSIAPEEAREPYIEILPIDDQERVITLIELLSPSNKERGSRTRDQYRAKQREILAGKTHLLEIDLQRGGTHTVAVPRHRLRRRGRFDYVVALSRASNRGVSEVWPFTVRQRMPRISVPLEGEDPDIIIDLQPLFDRCYDRAYSRRIDYRLDPPLALQPADADWADALLREKGLRS